MYFSGKEKRDSGNWSDEKRAECGILAKKGRECGIRTPASRPCCKGCGRIFTSLNFMQRHMKHYCLTRTTNRTWDCKKCSKRFASMHHLKIHVCIDSKKLPHQNIQKKKKIGYHNRLSNTNTGKKPYQCIHCNKVFNMLHHLTRPCTTVLTQVKSHISVHNVTRRLTNWV